MRGLNAGGPEDGAGNIILRHIASLRSLVASLPICIVSTGPAY